MVDWLYHHVEGFTDRRESRKYASNLLKAGYIRHTVNKITFSEQCYYIFGDLCGSMELGSALEWVGGRGWGRDRVLLGPLFCRPWQSVMKNIPAPLSCCWSCEVGSSVDNVTCFGTLSPGQSRI